MGLIKTAATVAVASAVHGRVRHRQQERWAAQDQARAAAMPPPPPAPYAPAAPVPPYAQAAVAPAQSVDMDARLAQLAQLGDLLKAGILNEAEFQQQKARILNG